jgi:hypothetical protein
MLFSKDMKPVSSNIGPQLSLGGGCFVSPKPTKDASWLNGGNSGLLVEIPLFVCWPKLIEVVKQALF